MPIRMTLRDKVFEVRAGMTVRDALRHVGLLPESVLATRKGELITEDEILREGDEVKLVAVISGGRGD
ncbi:MAG: MoaD/ThiS family protein [Anaerolineales bacterium]|nr:MoaD/ThiS family protein [Anaerolineales bacterium]